MTPTPLGEPPRIRDIASALRDVFARAARRLEAQFAIQGAAVGAVIGALWSARKLIAPTTTGQSIAPAISQQSTAIALIASAAVAGATAGWVLARTRRKNIANELERRVPHAQNLLVTAHELTVRQLAEPHGAWPSSHSQQVTQPDSQLGAQSGAQRPQFDAVMHLVLQRATMLAQSINLQDVLPASRSVIVAAAGLGLAAAIFVVGSRVTVGAVPHTARTIAAAVSGNIDITRVDVSVTPPAYARQRVTIVRDPLRVDALVGSTMIFAVSTEADSVLAVTKQGSRMLTRAANGQFALVLPATDDGFVVLEPHATGGSIGARKLIGVAVTTDQAPRVRLVEPTRDIIVPDAKRALSVRIDADDDLAVQTLRLRYTKVSGSGERFTFSEGEVPVTIAKGSATHWSAKASLALEPLLQEPGDLVVYRAVVTDSRPGSAPIESDALIAELAAPGGVAATGFSLDPDEDRYGLSQQMVILKTERLLAKQKTMTPAAVADEAMALATEQRRVRAEFVFMMGGEFAQEITADNSMGDLDETHEAESESDLSAGRMANRGRSALLSAVRAMSRASSLLTASDVASALASEKAALQQLQEAFARSRFLMRALSQREQLDMTRRLTGRLDSISRTRATVPDGDRDARTTTLRAILADVVNVGRKSPTSYDALIGLAERVLRADAGSPVAQRVAVQLNAASATAISNAQLDRRRALLDSAVVGLSRLIGDGLRPAPFAPMPTELRTLQQELDANLKMARRTRGRSPDSARP